MGDCWPPAATVVLAAVTGFLAAIGLVGLRSARELVRLQRQRRAPPDFTVQLDACRDAERHGPTARARAVTARGGSVSFFE